MLQLESILHIKCMMYSDMPRQSIIYKQKHQPQIKHTVTNY
uniref:Uncharacterized protein n=1 Tax=Arundo donax TaxID=35708 RepID=A0A0A8YRX1_ARUDO